MSNVLRRFPEEDTLQIEKGIGSYIYDIEGRQYLDMASNAMITNLGYTNPNIVNVLSKQAEKLCYAHNGRYTTELQERLADKLSTLAGGGYKVYFCSSGSETIESALRINTVYHKYKHNEIKKKVVASNKSYHGSTLGSLSLTGLKRIRNNYEHTLVNHYFIDVFSNTLNEIDIYLEKPDVGAVVLEPMSSNAAGAKFVPDSTMYFIREKTKNNDQLLIFDEISTSLGRTGKFFAFQHYQNVVPDIICLSKGIGVGYANVGAVLVKDDIANVVFDSKIALLGHSYNGHPIGCAVGLEVINTISKNFYLEKNLEKGNYILTELNKIAQNSPYIKEVRGKGMMISIILNEQNLINQKVERLSLSSYRSLRRLGIITLPGSGSIDGFKGEHITLSPPFSINYSEIDYFLQKMKYFVNNFEEIMLKGVTV